MGNFLVKLITSVGMMVGILAIAWFGAPLIYKHIVAGEVAQQTAKVQATALQADTQSANRAQANCAAEITASVKAGAAIAKLSQPVQQKGSDQPMITSAQIEQAIQ